MTDHRHIEGVNQGQPTAVWPHRKLACALLEIAKRGSEEGVEVEAEAVGLPLELVERFSKADATEAEDKYQQLREVCGGDAVLCVALSLLRQASMKSASRPSGTIVMDWPTFFLFSQLLLDRTHDRPPAASTEVQLDDDHRRATMAVLKKASTTSGRRRGSLSLELGYLETKQRLTERILKHFMTFPRRQSWEPLSSGPSGQSESSNILHLWRKALRDIELKTHDALLAVEPLAEPHARIAEIMQSTDFPQLTRRVKAEAARLQLDTAPIDSVFSVFHNLGHSPDLVDNAAHWRWACLCALCEYSQLEPSVTATMDKLAGLLDAEALPRTRAVVQQDSASTTTGSQAAGALPERYKKVWIPYTKAINMGRFDKNPTDREVFEWLIMHTEDISTMLKFETWQRYLRHARNFHGAQKNRPRRGREHGSSIVHVAGIDNPDQDDET